MLDQNTFIETVQSVAEIIRTSAEPIGRDEIMSYFKDMELNKAQEDMVFEFLITPHEQENESVGDYEDESQEELHGDESSENAALNNVIYSEGDSMDAIAGGKNNKAEQDNEAEPDIDEDSLIPDSPMFRMYLEELEEIHQRVQEVREMRQELTSLHDGEALRVDLQRETRVIQEKSMSYYDGDVTYRCIAVGFDPWFLPSEEEIEDEE